MSYWKAAPQGIDRAPAMQGEPTIYVTRERWEASVEKEIPMPLAWGEPFDGQLVDLAELLPVMHDPAALDAFSERGGAGLWPIEPMTEEEVQLIQTLGFEFVELDQYGVVFATLQTEKAHPAF